MNKPIDFGQCLSFINCQLGQNAKTVFPAENKPRWRAVTISRQTGTGGHLVAELAAERLRSHAKDGAASWMVFDQNLVEKVLEDHHLPVHLGRFMPEDRTSEIQDTLDDVLGLHPPTWTLVEKTGETILRLAELGNVLLIGRGANVITSGLDYVFHVRLIGSLEARIEFVHADRKLYKKTALAIIHQEDEGRRRYLRKYFHKDIDDPALYHLVINTPVVGHAAAAKLIADAILSSSGDPQVLPSGRG